MGAAERFATAQRPSHMRSLPCSHDTPASTRNEDVEDNSGLAAAAIPARPTVRWSDRRRSRMRPRGRHRCRRARMDRWCARAWIAPVRAAADLRAARDGRGALVMVTSASEVLSAPPAGCRIDEPACGTLTWCFRVRSVRCPRRPSAHRTLRPRAGRHPRRNLPGQATMWSTLVRHGQASRGEPNP